MGHHYVPRRLLQKFALPDRAGMVWQHDKQNKTAVAAAISQVAQERDFYSDETEDRLHYDVEKPGGNAVEKILDKKRLKPDEVSSLMLHIGTMIRRVPFHRQWAAEIGKDLFPNALAETRQNAYQYVKAYATYHGHRNEWIEERIREVDSICDRYAQETPKWAIDQMNDPFPREVIVGALLDMTWRIVESSGPQFFVISDNPVAYFRWEGYGLGGKETELVFPLSPSIALHGSRQRQHASLTRFRASQRIVREINKRIVSQASRFVFTHDNPYWLSKLLTRSDLGVMRIGWS